MDFQKDDELFLSALYTAANRSHHHQHRVGFAVTSRDNAIQEIQLRIDGDKKAAYVEDIVGNQADGKIVFVFSGMGTQWWGMVRNLMQSSDVFASNIRVSHNGAVVPILWKPLILSSDEECYCSFIAKCLCFPQECLNLFISTLVTQRYI